MTTQQLPVTFGKVRACVEVGGFRITEATYAANARVSRHEHQFPSWTAVLAGGFEERFSEGGHACRTGTLLAKPATAAHSNTYGHTGARVILVEISEAPIETDIDLHEVTHGAVRVLPMSAAGSRIRRLRAELASGPDGHSLGIHAAILDIGLLLLRTQTRPPPSRSTWLRRAISRLQSEFVHPPSLSVLAADCGVHPVYLCAAFRSAHGCSPGEFVRRLRIEHARRLLTTTTDTVSLVAFASGFSDQSHLTRQFRAATGMTPAEYRRHTSARAR